ncbi:hypothetical protein [Rhodanobacter sp. Root480]|uniref:hypothetical protein n=1 Tax=Rhodanobacter sp. Root480 TaxID=1736542 RepID=UPI000AB2B413|nr:hypothetical protein [Rhodanobacter sp. Root480]
MIKAVSVLKDLRINAYNVLFEVSIERYRELTRDVLRKNEFQRKRVRSSKTVYSLLRSDLQRQCVIPPIVLAVTTEIEGLAATDHAGFENLLTVNSDHLVILDGLQRTYTILDLLSDLENSNDDAVLREVLGSKIRVEVYFGINRLGILYRMLTLNTGQTPMSLRQQIEILYLDYLGARPDGVELIREADGRVAVGERQFNFKDVVEGFNSYLDRDELPIEKSDILENINSLEKLSKENQNTELFEKYVEALSYFVARVNGLAAGAELGEDYLEVNPSPFGRNMLQVFKKPQAFSGFGAAIGRLIDVEAVRSFDDVIIQIRDLEMDSPIEVLEEINNSLNWLKDNTKKIGNAQRSFFSYFFRDLFNSESDGYRDALACARSALRKYQGQNM